MDEIKGKNEGKQKPFGKVRIGAVTATVWKNKVETKSGSFEVATVTLDRSYQDKEQQWKQTGSLKLNDIPKAILALSEVYKDLTMKGNKEGQDETDD